MLVGIAAGGVARQVDLDHVVGRAVRQLRPLLLVDHVVGRRGHRRPAIRPCRGRSAKPAVVRPQPLERTLVRLQTRRPRRRCTFVTSCAQRSKDDGFEWASDLSGIREGEGAELRHATGSSRSTRSPSASRVSSTTVFFWVGRHATPSVASRTQSLPLAASATTPCGRKYRRLREKAYREGKDSFDRLKERSRFPGVCDPVHRGGVQAEQECASRSPTRILRSSFSSPRGSASSLATSSTYSVQYPR